MAHIPSAALIGAAGAPPDSPIPSPPASPVSSYLYFSNSLSSYSFLIFSSASDFSFSALLPIKQHIINPIKMATRITAMTIQKTVQSNTFHLAPITMNSVSAIPLSPTSPKAFFSVWLLTTGASSSLELD